MILKPGNLIQVVLNPTKGSEQSGMRPCIVISPKSLNKNLGICTVIPLTSTKRDWPTRVNTQISDKQGQAAIEQIRTISQSRIKKVIGEISPQILNEIRLVIRQTFTEN